MGLFKRTKRRKDGRTLEGRAWWGSYHDARTGAFVRRSTKCADKKAAATVLREWERRASDPHHRATHSATLRAGIATFLDHKRTLVAAGKRSQATVDFYEEKTAHLARLLGDPTIMRDLGAKDVDGYYADRIREGAHTNTVAKELTALRGVLKLANRHGLCEHPAAIMPAESVEDYKPKTAFVPDLPSLRALVGALHPSRRAHGLALVAFGLSWGESVRALPEDINLDTGLMRVRGTKNKYRERFVPIMYPELARQVLREAPGKRLLFKPWGNVRRDLHVASARALGILVPYRIRPLHPLSPNDLRRTFGTWLRQAGVEPQLIGPAMGHKDGRMSERVYGRLPAEDLKRLLEAKVHAGVRDAGARSGLPGLPGRRSLGETVPRVGIEPTTRGFSNRRVVVAKALKTTAGTNASGVVDLRVYASPSTFGALIDDALSLGVA